MKSEKTQRIFKVTMLVILTAVVTFLVTTIGMYNKLGGGSIRYILASGSNSSLSATLESYKAFLVQNYIGDLDISKMEEGAVKGYIEGIGDKYTEYITADEMEEYMNDANGNYLGVGIYMMYDTDTDQIIILSTIEDTPARRAGLKEGDIILKVDGVEYAGSQLDAASNAIKGEEGTKVTLEILRGEEVLQIELERAVVKVQHIATAVLEDNIGYMQISTFDEGCYDEFVKKYNELKEKNIESLIIDLRNNGGGIVEESLKIADEMIAKDKEMLIITSKNEPEEIEKSQNDKQINMPVVMLVNEYTASASEILVVAVKENEENCTIVGTKTYGKGVIQTVYRLINGGGLKLTTNEYLSPLRNKINGEGIEPDYEVKLPDGKIIVDSEDMEDTQLNRAIELLK